MPVWPGDPLVHIEQISSIQNAESSNISKIAMSVHTGTHIDAPKHFIDSEQTVDEIPLHYLVGEVVVLEIDDEVKIITDGVLHSHPKIKLIKNIKKVLFKTHNSKLWAKNLTEFQPDYVGISSSGAQYLADLNVELVGIDYLSIAPFDQTYEPHLILLSQGIVLLEGIDLSKVNSGIYQIFCLPLNIKGCEGAPARVILVQS
jgi:arylformamidase